MATRKGKRKLKLGRLIFLIFLLIIFAGGLIFFVKYKNIKKAISKTSEQGYFNIEAGSTSDDIITDLIEQGYVSDNQLMIKIYAKFNNLTNFKSGTFTLDKANSLQDILTTLNDATAAQTDTVTVTIIEGEWVKHIASKISSATNLDYDELINTWNDESYVRSLMNDYPFLTEEIFNENSRYLLEGYLFPDTYEFFIDTSVDEVTRKILDNTLSVYNELNSELNNNLTVHQWFTLASIVQYEASKVDDMKNVASVFFNRLAASMPLQSSVTVCYALDIDKDDSWQTCEINPTYDSPYNTYMVQGLPPGPILNPGRDALQAVLEPNNTDYYYFMADVYGDGTVYFSKTLAEHEALVAKYLN